VDGAFDEQRPRDEEGEHGGDRPRRSERQRPHLPLPREHGVPRNRAAAFASRHRLFWAVPTRETASQGAFFSPSAATYSSSPRRIAVCAMGGMRGKLSSKMKKEAEDRNSGSVQDLLDLGPGAKQCATLHRH
jgi:hypothetical protein